MWMNQKEEKGRIEIRKIRVAKKSEIRGIQEIMQLTNPYKQQRYLRHTSHHFPAIKNNYDEARWNGDIYA